VNSSVRQRNRYRRNPRSATDGKGSNVQLAPFVVLYGVGSRF
jgi:hypothetical protein